MNFRACTYISLTLLNHFPSLLQNVRIVKAGDPARMHGMPKQLTTLEKERERRIRCISHLLKFCVFRLSKVHTGKVGPEHCFPGSQRDWKIGFENTQIKILIFLSSEFVPEIFF